MKRCSAKAYKLFVDSSLLQNHMAVVVAVLLLPLLLFLVLFLLFLLGFVRVAVELWAKSFAVLRLQLGA